MEGEKKYLDLFNKINGFDISTAFIHFVKYEAYKLDYLITHREEDLKYVQEIEKIYNEESLKIFDSILEYLSEDMNRKIYDYLGNIYMQIRSTYKGKVLGQYFTPYTIAKFMAEIVSSDIPDNVNKKEYLSVSEPTCGSGVNIIAVCDCLKNKDVDMNKICFVAQDLDNVCTCMTYIQCCILNIPAIVITGNSLLFEVKEFFVTEPYLLNNYHEKLFIKKESI